MKISSDNFYELSKEEQDFVLKEKAIFNDEDLTIIKSYFKLFHDLFNKETRHSILYFSSFFVFSCVAGKQKVLAIRFSKDISKTVVLNGLDKYERLYTISINGGDYKYNTIFDSLNHMRTIIKDYIKPFVQNEYDSFIKSEIKHKSYAVGAKYGSELPFIKEIHHLDSNEYAIADHYLNIIERETKHSHLTNSSCGGTHVRMKCVNCVGSTYELKIDKKVFLNSSNKYELEYAVNNLETPYVTNSFFDALSVMRTHFLKFTDIDFKELHRLDEIKNPHIK